MDQRVRPKAERLGGMKLCRLFSCVWSNSASLRQLYYHVSKNHSLASFFLPDQLESIEIRGGLSKGAQMRLNLRHERSYFLGTHEPDVQYILARVVKPGMTVYNVGAHLGFFALMLSRLVGPSGHTIAFEPNPEVHTRLTENVALNRLENCIHVEGTALGDFDGPTGFSLSLSHSQGRFVDLPYVKSGPTIQVPCKRLDTYVEENKVIPDFILMDVEHAEGRVLRGMARILENHKPIIVVELHGEAAIKESWKEFQKHDYRVAKIPGMKIVQTLNELTYGHYLAAHSSYFREHRKV